MIRVEAEPTLLVIFGATGDLARNKIFPSLFDLYLKHQLPHSFTVIGSTHRPFGDDDFREYLRQEVFTTEQYDRAIVEEFLSHVVFVSGDFDTQDTYTRIGERIASIEAKIGLCPNKLFYLSTSPQFYESILHHLADSKIAEACSDDNWARILLEKPFGKDTHTAQQLDALLGELFNEGQVFRIDHYMAKESVRNLMTFRLANTIFEPAWNKDYVESVTIRMREEVGVEGRGKFYDAFGALRDVGQNHLLQMLALVAMEPCVSQSDSELRDHRADVLQKLIPLSPEDMKTQVVRGQYEGYRSIDGVSDTSDTETYFSITAYLDIPRWEGVPFVIESGKALSEDCAEISISFRNDRSASFLPQEYKDAGRNVLTFRIKPEEKITLDVWVGTPGEKDEAVCNTFSFNYGDLINHERKHIDAYEKILQDCISGDHTVFPRTDEVMAAWKFITPILEQFDTLPLHTYRPGSDGPQV